MKLRYVPLVASALLATGTVAACTPPDAQYAGICVDPRTHQRVSDDRCGDYDNTGHAEHTTGGFFYMWFPTTYGGHIPPIGERAPAHAGTRTVPAGTPIARGVPPQGGSMSSITRGGFGIKAGTTGGIGAKSAGS